MSFAFLCTSLPVHPQQQRSVAELLRSFETTKVFWQQFETAKAIVEAKDAHVLPKLQAWLAHEDRHLGVTLRSFSLALATIADSK